MKYYMGIDIGTSSAKTLLMREDGRVEGTAGREYDIKKVKTEFAEQDMDEIWEAVRQTIGELCRIFPVETSLIDGISYSGQMHGLVLVDKQGRQIRDGIIWADQRSGGQAAWVYETIGEEAFKDITLNDLSSGFLLTSLLWVKEHEPENYEKARRVLLPKDYIRYKMCGGFGTDMSDGSATLAFDTRRKVWAWEMIDRLGLDRALFPECHEAYETAGTLTKECGADTGLAPGIKVFYGGGDSLMQEAGNGVIYEGAPFICNIGTSCSLNCAVERPLFDPGFRTNTFCHVKEDLWMLMGANLCGGIVLKWLKNNVFFMPSYDAMTAAAEEAKAGSGGLLFLPYLSGSRCPVNDPGAKGVYAGLTLDHTRSHMIRSAMEGIVFGMKTSMDIFEEAGVHSDQIIASGGGARGRLFLQMEADILDKEVLTIEGEEQACMGAAITAAVGAGCYRDFKEACKAIVHTRPVTVLPIVENQKLYREGYQKYKELYTCSRPLF